jgi:hypothetical protein
MDLVTIGLTARADSDCQPENFTVDTARKWEKVGRFDGDLSLLLEEPDGLWLGAGPTDRIHPSALKIGKAHQSLYLIRPENLRFRIWRETNPFAGGIRKHRRGQFTYNGTSYDLGVTDPEMTARHFTPFPQIDGPVREIVPKDPNRCLLVISLTAPFIEYHYKLVATVIEY